MKSEIICPNHKSLLNRETDNSMYHCPDGCEFSIINSIPRFISTDNYASGFGLQWNELRTTQLDSFTGIPISRNRLLRLLGGSLELVAGKSVLEAGCGAGRFSEILLEAGAHLFAVDISTAVEANYRNCNSYSDYFVCQADILHLPLHPEQFDIVICIGVIQHTPNPEKTMKSLCRQVKPGGLLIMDHYTYGYPATISRRVIRSLLLKLPNKFSLEFCKFLTAILWPFHELLWAGRKYYLIRGLRSLFLKISPIVDYHDAYPELGKKFLKTWAVLDTHDTLTDYFKHLRSADEIEIHLKSCGMQDIETRHAGNGIEATARKIRK